jgi:hypothetical protein
MTRTAVRRHVDVRDGRLVIRRIVVATPACRRVASAVEPVVAAAPAGGDAARGRRPRRLAPGAYVVRVRETHLI